MTVNIPCGRGHDDTILCQLAIGRWLLFIHIFFLFYVYFKVACKAQREALNRCMQKQEGLLDSERKNGHFFLLNGSSLTDKLLP